MRENLACCLRKMGHCMTRMMSFLENHLVIHQFVALVDELIQHCPTSPQRDENEAIQVLENLLENARSLAMDPPGTEWCNKP